MFCPAYVGTPVVVGPASERNGSATVATPVVGAGLMRPASAACTPPVKRLNVAVRSPPPPICIELPLVVSVFAPPPERVTRVEFGGVRVVLPLGRVTMPAWPEPARARPATAWIVIGVRLPLTPRRNLVRT